MVGLLNARSHLFPLVFLFDMLLLSLILCFFLSNLSLLFLLKSDLLKISFPLPLKSPSILSRLAEPFPVRRSSKGLRSCNIFTVPAYYLTLSITKQRPKGRSAQWHCPFPNEGGDSLWPPSQSATTVIDHFLVQLSCYNLYSFCSVCAMRSLLSSTFV